MQTLVALYDDIHAAREASRDLVDIGVSGDNISLIANDAHNRYARYINPESVDTHTQEHMDASEGAGFGAVVGGLTGLLVGLGTLIIPGVGPVLGAGPLVATLAGTTTGVVAGTITGGMVGALIQAGVSESDAHIYAEGVRRGGALLVAHVDENQVTQAESILNRYNPVDLDSRSSYWRNEGWNRFDDTSQPYTPGEIDTHRETHRSPAYEDTESNQYARRYTTDRPAKV